jgi:hypothetical protein
VQSWEVAIDEKEAPEMTEASGLTDDQASLESASRRTHASEFETQLRSSIARVSEQVRQTTLELPLRSLFLAFILGVWVARWR